MTALTPVGSGGGDLRSLTLGVRGPDPALDRATLTPATHPADCEAFGTGLLAQSINAWSSLGYVACGLVVLALVARGRMARAFAALGIVTVLQGVGSLLYHGRPGNAAQILHDVPLAAMVGFVAGWHIVRLGAASFRRAGRKAIACLVIVAATEGIAQTPGLGSTDIGFTSIIVGGGAAAIVITEVIARRGGQAAVWTPALLLLVAVSAGAWLAGSAGSPLCDPDSPLQPHALWHVGSALAVLVWADRADKASHLRDVRPRKGAL